MDILFVFEPSEGTEAIEDYHGDGYTEQLESVDTIVNRERKAL